MIQRRALRCGDGDQNVARVGQHRDRLAQLFRIDMQRDAFGDGIAELFDLPAHVGERFRQLIDREQVVGERHARVVREQMPAQVRAQPVAYRGGQRRRRQPVARPREQRQRDQQSVVRLAIDIDHRAFGAAFGQVGKIVVRGLARARQIFECGLDGVVVAPAKPVIDQLDQAALPELFFEPAARFGQAASQFDETLCVDGLSAARANSSAAHE